MRINPDNLRALRRAVAIAAAPFIAYAAFVLCGGVYNRTPSVPVGIYWRTRTPDADRPPQRGDCVLATLPADGAAMRFALAAHALTTDQDRLVKYVAGVPGDFVEAEGATVTVTAADGSARAFARGEAKPQGGVDIPFVAMRRRLGPGEYFLAGTHPASYDSRYFGPVPLSAIVAVCAPVITWDGE